MTVTISVMSRYKDTSVYSDDERGEVFGPFSPPPEFTEQSAGWRVHVVRQNEVGMLDALAVRYFGDGYEKMWWCIALANGIVDADADMYPGQRIAIPPRTLAESYVGRSA